MEPITLTRPTDSTDIDSATILTCPDCGAATVSAQGIPACGRCRWYATDR